MPWCSDGTWFDSGVICIYLVERNSMSLFVFSSFSLLESSRSSRSSGVTKGKFPTLPAVLTPPRLVDEELEVELRPESTTGDACHSRKKSGAPKRNNKRIPQSFLISCHCFVGIYSVSPQRKNKCVGSFSHLMSGIPLGSWTWWWGFCCH